MADPTQRAQADPVPPTRRWPMLLGLGVLVVIGHGLLLDAMYGLRQPKSLLSDMAVPMYTRVLSQSAAPEPEAAAAPTAEDSVNTHPIASAAPTPRAKASTAARTKPRKRPASQAVASDEAEAQADAGTHDLPYDNSTEPDYAERQAAERQAEQRDALLASAASAASSSTASSASAAASQAPQDPASAAAPALASASQAAGRTASKGADGVGDAWPPNTRLNYKLGGNYRGELHGTARVLWQKDGPRYQAQVDLDLGLLASMRLTSQGEMTARSLKPSVYEELVRKKRRNVRLGEESIHLANGETAARPPNVQDTASQFIELSHRFASGQVPLTVGQTVQFALVRPNRVAQWTYDVVEDTQIHLPNLGPTRALLVRPRPVDGEKQNVSAQMWLAPSLQYLPVRIVLTMGNGDTQVDLMLERIDQGDGASKPAP